MTLKTYNTPRFWHGLKALHFIYKHIALRIGKIQTEHTDQRISQALKSVTLPYTSKKREIRAIFIFICKYRPIHHVRLSVLSLGDLWVVKQKFVRMASKQGQVIIQSNSGSRVIGWL